MQTTQFVSALIILIVMIFTCDSQTTRLCRKGGCNEKCSRCPWGKTYNDDCGFYECAKGPGQPCNEQRKDCGESLQCRCGRCHGCSSTIIGVDCHTSPCLPSENNMIGYNY